jgi:putative flippase GtrA
VAGVLGFLVDAATLYLIKLFAGIYLGRSFSFSMAVVVTWIFNRNVTFKQSNVSMGMLAEFLKYFLLMIVGGVINLGVYYILISSSQWLQNSPILAVAAGCLAGIVANFLKSRFLLYKK